MIETAEDSAVVELLDLTVEFVASPLSLPEPGGEISYTVTIANAGTVEVNLTKLDSPQFGDLTDLKNGNVSANTCAVGENLPTLAVSGGSFSCTFIASRSGQPGVLVQAVEVTGSEISGVSITKTETVEVVITDVAAQLSAEVTPAAQSIPAPGGDLQFELTVSNDSLVDAITLEQLHDSLLGPLHGQGSCILPQILAPADQYRCTYSAPVVGTAGQSIANIVSVFGEDDDEPPNTVAAVADTTVSIGESVISLSYIPSIIFFVDEPNNTCHTAFPLQLNRTYFFFANDSNDWYTFELTEPGDLTLELTDFAPREGQIVVYKGEQCGSNLEIMGNNGNSQATKIVPLADSEPGRYFARILNDAAPNLGSPYALFVRFEP
jgi:hypothetical protein